MAALRAARYHAEAEAALLNLSPEGLAALEQEAIRRGLGYDDLAAQVLIERLQRLHGEAGSGPDTQGGEAVDEQDGAGGWKDGRSDQA